MTNEEIRIAVAEACGWTDISKYTQAADGWYGYAPGNGPHSKLPNYPEDLNAMHEAEKELVSGWLWNTYTSKLAAVCGWNSKIHDVRTMANVICSATARQRAEAFLRTLGLWKD